jgi:hypothetical protein
MCGQRDRHLGHRGNPHLRIRAEQDWRGFPSGALREAGSKGKNYPPLAAHYQTGRRNVALLYECADTVVRLR